MFPFYFHIAHYKNFSPMGLPRNICDSNNNNDFLFIVFFIGGWLSCLDIIFRVDGQMPVEALNRGYGCAGIQILFSYMVSVSDE